MKIVHICLACFYVEGMGYQENILPKIHSQMGNEVTVITSSYSFNAKGETTKKTQKEYVNDYNVRVKVLDKKSKPKIFSRYSIYEGLYDELVRIKPDVIFVHGGQFLSIHDVIRYAKRHKVNLYLDQHADYYNTPVNTIKSIIWHKVIFRYGIKKFSKLASKVYGVTPWRCQYLNEVYSVPKDKIELLVMGGDDEKIDFEGRSRIREEITAEYNIDNDAFLIVTGGKIDRTKNIHLLMQAVAEAKSDNIALIVFGQANAEMENEISNLAQNPKIRTIGWISADEAYNYFLAADLVVFPGTHSVMWEQACACGTPCVFKHWEGMHHVDVGGSCEFLYEDSAEEMKKVIEDIAEDKEKYAKMKNAAQKGIKEFSYNAIAKRAINI